MPRRLQDRHEGVRLEDRMGEGEVGVLDLHRLRDDPRRHHERAVVRLERTRELDRGRSVLLPLDEELLDDGRHGGKVLADVGPVHAVGRRLEAGDHDPRGRRLRLRGDRGRDGLGRRLRRHVGGGGRRLPRHARRRRREPRPVLAELLLERAHLRLELGDPRGRRGGRANLAGVGRLRGEHGAAEERADAERDDDGDGESGRELHETSGGENGARPRAPAPAEVGEEPGKREERGRDAHTPHNASRDVRVSSKSRPGASGLRERAGRVPPAEREARRRTAREPPARVRPRRGRRR